MAKLNRIQIQALRSLPNVALHIIEYAAKSCYRATMTITGSKLESSSAREAIHQIADVAIADAAAVGQLLDRSELIAELIALFDVELSTGTVNGERDEVPPWRKFPAAFSSRFHYVQTVIESSETSSYYESIPLDAPLDVAKRKVAALANSYLNYPED